MMTRRAMLTKVALGVAGVASGAVPFRIGNSRSPSTSSFSPQDESFLDEVERASFRALWENSHPQTGLVVDLIRPEGNDLNTVSSIAATGFGLTGLCIGAERGWIGKSAAADRARITLRFLHDQQPNVKGFYYHFVNWHTGQRLWQSEVSSIDSAILLCGVLTCRQYFEDAEIQMLATQIYDRMDWRWLYQEGPFLSHGWTPERGILASKWDTFSEHMMLYLLAIGANENAIPAAAWNAWHRPWVNHGGGQYIDAPASLFIHQYSHAWFDFRGRRDAHTNYFENSIVATHAHRQFCMDLRAEFPQYSADYWGISASESPKGYVIWGGPPRLGPIDGTIVPCAAAGSLPFLPQPALRVLQQARERQGRTIWGHEGFADAFNPATGWVAKNRVALNTGITLLMAENARTGFLWETFMRNPEARTAMNRAGLEAAPLV